MKILFFGDVYGKPGRLALAKVLPSLIEKHSPDFVLANAENLAHGRGPASKQLRDLQKIGIDGFTSGNHIFDSKEGVEMLTKNFPLTRPANYHSSVPGKTHFILRRGGKKLFVSNLLGRIFMGDPLENPFHVATEILKLAKKKNCKHIFFDFHAEATSEKMMFGLALDGKASAIVGTHTHIQTADERILPRGTAFISDAGFCGSLNSVIGASAERAKIRFETGMPVGLAVATNPPFVVSGVAIELKDSGRAKSIERIREIVE